MYGPENRERMDQKTLLMFKNVFPLGRVSVTGKKKVIYSAGY